MIRLRNAADSARWQMLAIKQSEGSIDVE